MSEAPVVDASPLIHLATAGLIELLLGLGPRVVVPEGVADEVRVHGPEDAAVRTLTVTPWLQVVSAVPVPPEIAAWDLGRGETAVLSWAHAHPGCMSILDDRQARRCAATLRVPVIGTLGVVLKAKAGGRLSRVRPVIEQLVQKGMYLSEVTISQALRLVGE